MKDSQSSPGIETLRPLQPCPVCSVDQAMTFERGGGLWVTCCENDDCAFTVQTLGGSREEAERKWNSRADAQTRFTPGEPVEIREQNNAIDEIVIHRGDVHIEQLSSDSWFMGVDACDGSYWQFWFGAKNRKSHVEFRHTETVPSSENVAQPSQGAGNGEAVAWTNEAQLGFLKDSGYADIPMAMWAKPTGSVKIPLFAAPQPTTAGYTPNVPRFMEVVRSRWNFEENEFDAIEKVLLDPKCAAALSLPSTRPLPAAVEYADIYAWPIGCHSPNSCHRNGRCMYVGCKHDGKDIAALAALAIPSTDGKSP